MNRLPSTSRPLGASPGALARVVLAAWLAPAVGGCDAIIGLGPSPTEADATTTATGAGTGVGGASAITAATSTGQGDSVTNATASSSSTGGGGGGGPVDPTDCGSCAEDDDCGDTALGAGCGADGRCAVRVSDAFPTVLLEPGQSQGLAVLGDRVAFVNVEADDADLQLVTWSVDEIAVESVALPGGFKRGATAASSDHIAVLVSGGESSQLASLDCSAACTLGPNELSSADSATALHALAWAGPDPDVFWAAKSNTTGAETSVLTLINTCGTSKTCDVPATNLCQPPNTIAVDREGDGALYWTENTDADPCANVGGVGTLAPTPTMACGDACPGSQVAGPAYAPAAPQNYGIAVSGGTVATIGGDGTYWVHVDGDDFEQSYEALKSPAIAVLPGGAVGPTTFLVPRAPTGLWACTADDCDEYLVGGEAIAAEVYEVAATRERTLMVTRTVSDPGSWDAHFVCVAN